MKLVLKEAFNFLAYIQDEVKQCQFTVVAFEGSGKSQSYCVHFVSVEQFASTP